MSGTEYCLGENWRWSESSETSIVYCATTVSAEVLNIRAASLLL